MLFEFLKYLHPTHYFQRFRKNGESIYPISDSLPEKITLDHFIDTRYLSPLAQEYDQSFRAIKNGYIGDCPTYKSFETIPLSDNYRFIRKNFHHTWVLYVLMVRILSFYNPIEEIRAWSQSKNMRRDSFNLDNIIKNQPISNRRDISKTDPLVSVVIPTLNRYNYLKEILSDFEQQDYRNFEIIVVDQSDDFDKDFYNGFNLNINLIQQKEKALWLARNRAIEAAKGELIALSEDDVRIGPNWLSSHLKCLRDFNAQVSAGVFFPNGKQIPIDRSFFAIATQFATGNAMLYKSVFKTVGLFDRQFEKQRMGDGEFGMRLYLNNIKSISNPIAKCIDVKASSGGLREMGSWDAFRPSKLFAPRPIPSVLYYYRKYYGDQAALLDLLRNVPLSVVPYRFKKNKPMLLIGLLITLLLSPIILCQVIWSWKLASIKLKEGAKISHLS